MAVKMEGDSAFV